MRQSKIGLLLGLLGYTVAMRLIPYVLRNCDVALDSTITCYPWNFSPLTAVCLMSGACVVDRRLAYVLPLAAMFLSNIGIGFISGHWEWAFPPNSWWVPYAGYFVAVWLGTWLRQRSSKHQLSKAIGLGLAFEVFFFAVSNFTWFYGSSSLYPQTLSGLVQCYTAALPFFRNAPLSTLGFTFLIFGPLGVMSPSTSARPIAKPTPVT